MSIALPVHLDGRRLAREQQRPSAAGVAREVDEDVDSVLPDQAGGRLTGQRGDVAPLVAQLHEPTRDGIRMGDG
jgi:hypothetical protein